VVFSNSNEPTAILFRVDGRRRDIYVGLYRKEGSMMVSWTVKPCGLGACRRFGGTYCLHLQYEGNRRIGRSEAGTGGGKAIEPVTTGTEKLLHFQYRGRIVLNEIKKS
jgi:hypothetical protein